MADDRYISGVTREESRSLYWRLPWSMRVALGMSVILAPLWLPAAAILLLLAVF